MNYVEIEMTDTDVANFRASLLHIGILWAIESDAPAEPVVWASFAPHAYNYFHWHDDYAVYESSAPPPSGGGHVDVYAQTLTSRDGRSYCFDANWFHEVPGATPDRFRVTNQLGRDAWFGLSASAVVNGMQLGGPLNVAQVGNGQTAAFALTPRLHVFATQLATGYTTGGMPANARPVEFANRSRVAVAFNPNDGLFHQTA